MASHTINTYRMESSHKLESDWLPASAFSRAHDDCSTAVATAIEGVDEPAEQEVRVVCVETGEIVSQITNTSEGLSLSRPGTKKSGCGNASQECSSCGYVDRRNRRSQSEFLCRSWGRQKHPDVHAACTVKGRRSAGLGDKFLI